MLPEVVNATISQECIAKNDSDVATRLNKLYIKTPHFLRGYNASRRTRIMRYIKRAFLKPNVTSVAGELKLHIIAKLTD